MLNNVRLHPSLTPPFPAFSDGFWRRVPLSEWTTLRMGGAAWVGQPGCQEELISVLQFLRREVIPFLLLGNGSNLLVQDKPLGVPVISTKSLKQLCIEGQTVTAEAGVRLPRLVQFAAQASLGGLEYLASVPGTVGGAICMNAGRGANFAQSVHDRAVWVRVWAEGKVLTLGPKELGSAFRGSIFQTYPEWCVLEAYFRLDPLPRELVRQRVAERLRYTRRREDHSAPNAGSVFRIPKPFGRIRGKQIGNASFSTKTSNWILNRGASFEEMLKLIDITGTREELEWVVWQPDQVVPISPLRSAT